MKIASEEAENPILVAATGIEPVTLGLWVLRSNQLSYGAKNASDLDRNLRVRKFAFLIVSR